MIEAIYQRVAVASRQPALYLQLGIADTAEGRFEALTLHAWMFLRRLRQLPDPAEAVGQDVIDVLFRELDRALRELGVGDLSVGKRMKKLAKAFYGRLTSYEAALHDGSDDALALALGRNLLDSENPAGPEFVSYVRSSVRHLDGLDLQAILDGARLFVDIDPASGSAP